MTVEDEFDNMRPYADHPALTDERIPDLNQLWVDAAFACWIYAGENGTSGMNPEEICLAVSACMTGDIADGGTRQWLLWNMDQPDLAAFAVPSLEFMGSRGMAGHIRRTLEACLGPREAWAGLQGEE